MVVGGFHVHVLNRGKTHTYNIKRFLSYFYKDKTTVHWNIGILARKIVVFYNMIYPRISNSPDSSSKNWEKNWSRSNLMDGETQWSSLSMQNLKKIPCVLAFFALIFPFLRETVGCLFYSLYVFLILTWDHCFIALFRERERERETVMWETNIDWLPSPRTLIREGTCNLSMCPDWELNLRPFIYRMLFQPSKSHWPRLTVLLFKNIYSLRNFLRNLWPIQYAFSHDSWSSC